MPADQKITMGKGVLVMTYACNLKCSFCYAGAEVFGSPKTMRSAEAYKGIDFMESIGISTFTLLGGEPTIHRDLLDVVAYAHAKNMGAWVVTNGVKVSDPAFGQSMIDAGLKGGCISLHGHTPEEHDKATRIPGSYDKAMTAVRHAVERGWPLYPMLTVMDSNLPNVLRVVENLVALGCRTIYVNYGVPNVVQQLDTGVASGPEALARLTEQLFRLQPELGVRFIFNREKNKIPLCSFDHATLKDMFADQVIGTGCEAAQGNTVVIEPGGKVLGCSHWVDHPLINIYKDRENLELLTPEEFWEMWHSGRPKEYRDELRFYPFEQCVDCGWRKDGQCYGGCKIWQQADVLPKTYAFDGDEVVPYRRRLLPLDVVRG
ncbi:radical SAM protein [Streptomyces sp. NPDC048751]|uniref:radical SAM protein n=1 Tax=Streptomyces sp. NPDC048751 TaxID=3365591 RepID=UPI003714157E